MDTVSPPGTTESISFIFKLNNDLVTRSFDGVADADCWRRPAEHGNPLAWLLGHVTISRASLLAKLGRKYDPGLGRLFDRGSKFDAAAAYPDRAAIAGAWADTRRRMRDAFAMLSEEMLAAPPSGGSSLPGVTSNARLIAFYAFHESYHVGQMGYVRKLLGLGTIAG